nr:hypothetical protein [Clostridia bacterium]
MDGISLNELYTILGTSAYSASGTSSTSGSDAFSKLLSAQLSDGSVFGSSNEDDGFFSSDSSSSLLGMTALLSSFGGEADGETGLGGALQSYCMLLGSGVSGAGLAAAVASLSSALKNAPDGALENIRAALLSSDFS